MEKSTERMNITRGVFSPKYTRIVLFKKMITVKTAELPKWKPKVI